MADNGKSRRWLTRLRSSDIFLAIGTKNFLDGLKTNEDEVYDQVQVAKQYGRPVIILIDDRLSPSEKEELRFYFREFKRVLAEIPFNSTDHNSIGELASRITEVVVKYVFEPPA